MTRALVDRPSTPKDLSPVLTRDHPTFVPIKHQASSICVRRRCKKCIQDLQWWHWCKNFSQNGRWEFTPYLSVHVQCMYDMLAASLGEKHLWDKAQAHPCVKVGKFKKQILPFFCFLFFSFCFSTGTSDTRLSNMSSGSRHQLHTYCYRFKV